MKQKLRTSISYSSRTAEGYKKAKKYKSLINYVRQHSNNTSAQVLLAQCYEHGWGVDVNPTKVAEWYKKAADKGNTTAIVNLAICYRYGKGVDTDVYRAVELYRLAAQKGSATAINNLGICYENGTVVNIDVTEAVKLYEEAANKGSFAAKVNLARCYEYGIGVCPNVQSAKELYLDAARYGNASAQYHLGLLYSSDVIPEHDDQIAADYFELAAKQGHSTAQFHLARLYEEGRGIEKNIQKAVRYYELSARQGYAPAILNLGVCYANGSGVEKDVFKAIELYIEAATKGNATAQFYLGRRYENGDGVEENIEKAVEYYTLAVNQGHDKAKEFLPDAQYYLGSFYENDAIPPDIDKAYELYHLASTGGSLSATWWLGLSYYYGVGGVPADYSQAVSLLTSVAEHDWQNKYEKFLVANSMCLLGECYEKGKHVEADMGKAVTFYQSAADLEDSGAQYRLAVCYHDGTVLEKNDQVAYDWFVRAAEHGEKRSYIYLGFFYEKGLVVDRSNKIASEWYTKSFLEKEDEAEEAFNSDYLDYLLYNIRETDTLHRILSQTELLEKDKEALQKRIVQLEKEKRQIQSELEQKKQGVLSNLQFTEIMQALKTIEQKTTIIEITQKEEFARTEAAVAAVEELEDKISSVEGKVQEGLEKLNEVDEKLDQILNWCSSYTMEKKKALNGNQDEKQISKFIDETANKIIDRLYSGKVVQSSDFIQVAESELKGLFGVNWDKLDFYTRRSLISAKVFLAQSEALNDESLDFSGIVVSATSALEKELKLRLFVGAQKYFAQKAIPISNWPELLKFYDAKNEEWIENTDFTLGKMSFLLFPRDENDRIMMNDYLTTILRNNQKQYGSRTFSYRNPKSFIDRCKEITDNYRNPAAHTEPVGMSLAIDCCDNIIGAAKRVGAIQGLILELLSLTDNYENPNL